MNRTHPDKITVIGGEQCATSEPGENDFRSVTERRELGEARGEAQDTDYSHHIQTRPALKRGNTQVRCRYRETNQHIPPDRVFKCFSSAC